jgi:hypothetical protein
MLVGTQIPPIPTFNEIRPANEGSWKGPSDEEYKVQQDRRKIFKSMPLSKHPYLGTLGNLNKQEMEGFHSAGILFWREGPTSIDVLMGCEDRWRKWGDSGPIGTPTRGLVLLGGMRNSIDETPRDVAVREAMEESGNVFGGKTQAQLLGLSGHIAWIPASKYCLHFFQVTDEDDMAVDSRFNQLSRGPAGGPIAKEPAMVALRWVPLAALREAARGRRGAGADTVHDFTLDMIRTLEQVTLKRTNACINA